MENIFIHNIFTLTEAILRGDQPFDTALAQLETHLARARKIKSVRYEAEVLNTLGILYMFAGKREVERHYFSEGLEKALLSDDIDLKLKLLSNSSESYLEDWEFDSANRFLDEGMALGQQNNLTTLTMLYVYSNKANWLVQRGDFKQAADVLNTVWTIAENTEILKYSKYEYLQVVFLIQNTRAITEIALHRCESALPPLRHAAALVLNMKNVDYHVLINFSQLYFALFCKENAEEAHEWESKAAEAAGGQLTYKHLLPAASFMMHNHQETWAKKYAALVMEQQANQMPIPAAAVTYARSIIENLQHA